MRVRVRVRVRACLARARARGLIKWPRCPAGGPRRGLEGTPQPCGVAKVETRGRVPGVGRIVVVTPARYARDIDPEASTGERDGAAPAAAED